MRKTAYDLPKEADLMGSMEIINMAMDEVHNVDTIMGEITSIEDELKGLAIETDLAAQARGNEVSESRLGRSPEEAVGTEFQQAFGRRPISRVPSISNRCLPMCGRRSDEKWKCESINRSNRGDES